MLGKNHAVWAAALWATAWPFVDRLPTMEEVDTNDLGLFAVTLGVAAGSGVIPDLDHPDAKPSKHFGMLSGIASWALNKGSGGHRFGTHSIFFAVLVGVLSYLAQLWPTGLGGWAAVIACAFCGSVGLTLVGPSLGLCVHPGVSFAAAAIPAWYVWNNMSEIGPLLWLLASGGVLTHILCDAVTKGGVPIFWPCKWRLKLNWFRVGGPGEQVAGVFGVIALGYGLWTTATAVA